MTTPTTPAIDRLKEDFKGALIWAGMKGTGTYQFTPEQLDEGIDSGFKLLNQFYAEEMLKIVGEDEDESCPLNDDLGYHGKSCWDECHPKIVRNQLKAELRTAITKRFNENN